MIPRGRLGDRLGILSALLAERLERTVGVLAGASIDCAAGESRAIERDLQRKHRIRSRARPSGLRLTGQREHDDGNQGQHRFLTASRAGGLHRFGQASLAGPAIAGLGNIAHIDLDDSKRTIGEKIPHQTDRDVEDRCAGARAPLRLTAVCVAVKNRVDRIAGERLFEPAAAEKRINLARFSFDGVLDRGVVQYRNQPLAAKRASAVSSFSDSSTASRRTI